jgi:hypothetical protein
MPQEHAGATRLHVAAGLPCDFRLPPRELQKRAVRGNGARTLSAMSASDPPPADGRTNASTQPANATTQRTNATGQPSPNTARSIALPMRTTLRVAGVALMVGLPVAGGLGAVFGGSAGFWGAVLGLGIPALFFGITVITALLTAGSPSSTMVLVVGGTWVVKIVLLFVILAVLTEAQFWSRTAFFIAFLAGVVGWLVAEVAVVARTKTPYVDT